MFIDEARIRVHGGRGGHGCVSFRREKFIPRGGPSGGDGGNGGSVYCVVAPELNTLLDFAGHHDWRAESGVDGMGRDRHGKNGEDRVVHVPPGTAIYDDDTGILLKDLTDPDQRVRVARGGHGGRGNAFFKGPVNQAPRYAEEGTPGRSRNLRLELKLVADVGLAGLPNAGKSTLLSRLSAARPKIAAYPFTTLAPQLGIVELPGFRRYVMADIPGLIEGAHTGAGLGDGFLRHIERTRLVVHIVDIAPMDGDPVDAYRTIRHELSEHSAVLAAKPEIIVANKMDLTDADEHLDIFREELGKPVLAISGVTGAGLDKLNEMIWSTLGAMPTGEPKPAETKTPPVYPSGPHRRASTETDES